MKRVVCDRASTPRLRIKSCTVVKIECRRPAVGAHPAVLCLTNHSDIIRSYLVRARRPASEQDECALNLLLEFPCSSNLDSVANRVDVRITCKSGEKNHK